MFCGVWEKNLGVRVANFLRQKHPQKTAAHVAAATAFGEHRVKAWLEYRARPDGVAVLALAAAYGPEFLVAVMPERCAWIEESARAAELRRLAEQHAALSRRIEELSNPTR